MMVWRERERDKEMVVCFQRRQRWCDGVVVWWGGGVVVLFPKRQMWCDGVMMVWWCDAVAYCLSYLLSAVFLCMCMHVLMCFCVCI